MPFVNREDAGRQLAERLAPLAKEGPLVVGLPRGGVPVALEVAKALGAPLDVTVARKLGAPGNPELGMGAVAAGGVVVVDASTARLLGVTEAAVADAAVEAQAEVERRLVLFRGEPRGPEVRGRVVVVVDDGLATGGTAAAAVRSLKAGAPARVVLAVPVGAPAAVERLRGEADEVVCLETPFDFRAVGQWYGDFSQTSDDEVVRILAGATGPGEPPRSAGEIRLPAADGASLVGDLEVPEGARGVVLFAHGSGSGRRSPRNRAVARRLRDAGLATLLLDLLTGDEEREDAVTTEHRFDIPLLASRVVAAAAWLAREPATRDLRIGVFGSSTGGGAALIAAAKRPDLVRAVVSRGGRPDLAWDALDRVEAPTLLVVGERDAVVRSLNARAAARLRKAGAEMAVVPRATHLFEEPGALETVADLAADWLVRHLGRAPAALP